MQRGRLDYLMQDKIEPLTTDELSLLQYLFWKHRNDCYAEIGTSTKESIGYKNSVADLTRLSEIERKLEVHLT